ncbi:MAG: hypothetical protein CVU71_02635 [Deltaproteobacteria bacterium HGW-Deltaproteobacteria-6]|jgi:pyruvate-formate lyase|nr:MAG: hypothetical protein CVU71_02635 [Deltaproteobacteria bacterium HGW-Deltaproteobacteria-6]
MDIEEFGSAAGSMNFPHRFFKRPPSIVLRMHDGTPDEVYSKAAEVIKTGIGYPSLFNDEALIPLFERWGVSTGDARQYAVTGEKRPLKNRLTN